MGLFKKKTPTPGLDKMNVGKSVKLGGKITDEAEMQKKYGQSSRTRPLAFVFAFSMVFAFIYSEFYVESNRLLSLISDPMLNKLFFGPGYAAIMNDKMLDQVINIFARTFFFMGVFGLSPFLTYLAGRITDTKPSNYYFSNWTVMAFTAFMVALVYSLLGPLLMDVIDLMFM